VIKPAYSVSFLLSINIFVRQNVLYFPNDLRIYTNVNLYTEFRGKPTKCLDAISTHEGKSKSKVHPKTDHEGPDVE
jgi:hypothetical protein